MKMLLRLSREAIRCKSLYVIAILSTIRSADQILVIEDGRVTEAGTHAELVALGGSYARMDRIQSSAADGIA